jgi:hypothetical protein
VDLTYLASPYSNPDPAVVRERFELACLATGMLLERGIFVFSPIVHCHPAAMQVALPQDFSWWEAYDRRMIRGCESLTVLRMPGKAEVEYAKELGMPIYEAAFRDGKSTLTWERTDGDLWM